jgi:hypothetical protein
MDKNLKKFNEIKDFKKHGVKPVGSTNSMGESKNGTEQKKGERSTVLASQGQKDTKTRKISSKIKKLFEQKSGKIQ